MAHENQFGLGHDALAQQMAATRSYQRGLPTFMRHLYGFGNVPAPTVPGAHQRVNTADSNIADALSTLGRRRAATMALIEGMANSSASPSYQPRCRLPECGFGASDRFGAEGFCDEHYENLLSWKLPR